MKTTLEKRAMSKQWRLSGWLSRQISTRSRYPNLAWINESQMTIYPSITNVSLKINKGSTPRKNKKVLSFRHSWTKMARWSFSFKVESKIGLRKLQLKLKNILLLILTRKNSNLHCRSNTVKNAVSSIHCRKKAMNLWALLVWWQKYRRVTLVWLSGSNETWQNARLTILPRGSRINSSRWKMIGWNENWQKVL